MKKSLKFAATLALAACFSSAFAQTTPPAGVPSNTPASQDDNMSSMTMKHGKMHKGKMSKMDKTSKMDKKMGKMDKMDKKM